MIGVLGPGTGLGVGGVFPVERHWIALTGEGGHVSLPAGTEREGRVLEVMRRRFGHASAERALSGRGLVNLYEILAEIDGVPTKPYAPADVTEMAVSGGDAHCREALEMFAGMLGTEAGDLALTLGAKGGLYRRRHRAAAGQGFSGATLPPPIRGKGAAISLHLGHPHFRHPPPVSGLRRAGGAAARGVDHSGCLGVMGDMPAEARGASQ